MKAARKIEQLHELRSELEAGVSAYRDSRERWRVAIEEGRLDDAWREFAGSALRVVKRKGYDEGLAEPLAKLARNRLWMVLLFPEHDDIFDAMRSRAPKLNNKRYQKHAVGLARNIEPSLFASAVELALESGQPEAWVVARAELRRGVFHRSGGRNIAGWSFALRLDHAEWKACHPASMGPQFMNWHRVFGCLFALAFLKRDGEAYMALIRAGFDDAEFLSQCRPLFNSYVSQPAAFERLCETLRAHGHPSRTVDDWLRFIDFREEAIGALEDACQNMDSRDPMARQVARDGAVRALSRATGDPTSALLAATLANDEALARQAFEVGANPNSREPFEASLFGALGLKMSPSMSALWLANGANPLLAVSHDRSDEESEACPLYQFVEAGALVLVEQCVLGAQEPLDLTAGQDGANPFADFAASRAEEEPKRAREFLAIESLLRNEPGRQASLALGA